MIDHQKLDVRTITMGISLLGCASDDVGRLCDNIYYTITRRAERRVITLSHDAPVNPLVLQYLNRLSDFFFVFARFNNVTHQFEEIYWDKNA